MREILWVAVCGAIGAVARHGAGVAAAKLLGPGFPWATLAVNVLGSFALAVLFEATGRAPWATPQLRIALGTGFLGAFTTFSTFSVETVKLASASPLWAVANVVGNVVLGLVAAAVGLALTRLWIP